MTTRHSLDSLFRPKSIAVIGASGTATKIGGVPIAHLKRYGYRGEIYPINPQYESIQDLRAYKSVKDVGKEIDLAIVAVPAAVALQALTEAADAKVKSVVLFTSGFAEVGEAGAKAQQKIAELSRNSGMRILGPNCLGVMSGESAVYATFSPVAATGIAKIGGIGLVSQSGAFGGFAYSLARERGLGLSHWVTTGNEADVELADCLDWLVDDAATKVILAYMEGCRDGAKLTRVLEKARAAKKPVVIVKVGRTELGAAAAASHTAALAGADAIYDAVFRQYGVWRAATIEEAFDVAYAVSVAGVARGKSIGMLTASGGAGVLMADAAASLGLDAKPMPDAAQRQILARVAFASARNPVDVTGQITSDHELMPLAYRLMLEDGDYDSLVVFQSAAGLSARGPELVQQAIDMRAKHPDRVIALSSLFTPELHHKLDEGRVLAFADPSRAVRAIAALASYATSNAAAKAQALPKVDLPRGTVSEAGALASLKAAGIPVMPHRLARNAAEATAAAESFGYPVVAKIVSPDILHKTEIGGVILNLKSKDEVANAFDELMSRAKTSKPQARIEGVLIAPMVKGGVECILGVQRDPVFGPVVMFGLGGVLVEALRDVSFRLAPFDETEAHRMIDSIKARAVLDGWRGAPAADVDALADTLVALSRFAATAGDRLESVDINPFVVRAKGEGAIALDAVLVTKE
ncbi:acetate--CoA ligase family protein [Bradyrhizobium sp. LHD-71]|uniref:acetate--CoA ligase family protein n=1 Tax=Bradyrhizobium sp. LHD-71 TaxID=3072141 RepID=UPI00280CD55D|nr:acetate--CoA ligase family protein [Bradyrhizobium sp. LHD-71]MDQ8730999.1 acetate--CoA ligase family protein [Bradyrhizobium sp. LHD-71]